MTPEKTAQELIQAYGDLLFDFCQSTLGSTAEAEHLFELIHKEIEKTKPEDRYQTFERAWAFRIAYDQLLRHHQTHASLTAAQQIELDALSSAPSRLKHFLVFFQRLPAEDRILLLMRDKYGLPWPEISATLGISEASLQTRRSRALRTLEEWVWSAE